MLGTNSQGSSIVCLDLTQTSNHDRRLNRPLTLGLYEGYPLAEAARRADRCAGLSAFNGIHDGNMKIAARNTKTVVSSMKTVVYDFKRSYNQFDDSRKWKLEIGTRVEDALYEYGKTMKKEHLCHSFILDPYDKTYTVHKVFTEREIALIKNYQKKESAPRMPEELYDYMRQYKCGQAKPTAAVREIVFRQQTWDKPFDREKSFDLVWVRCSYYQFVQELKAGDIDSNDRTETWLISRIRTMVDKVFSDIKVFHVSRGEKTSSASSSRKNKNRIPQGAESVERKKLGRRLDMILQRARFEVGGGEAGKHSLEYDTKMLQERDLKLPRALKDMLMMLKEKTDEKTLTSLTVVGVLQYGLRMNLLRMDMPCGYIRRVSRTDTVTVPHCQELLPSFRLVLYMAWCAKTFVRKSLEELKQSRTGDDSDSDDSYVDIMELKDDDNLRFPSTFTTPDRQPCE
ncbi:hypothetical protein BCR43DRAFT_509413 [Syncephalastrum racemosum]|uniref:Uncharacterized protein n=1 Tax=Syncephalastrum racemosum TaxID=13706 RepID=A0A1X2HRL2_SYNRA|nr:hypothetical protein BCR43DRAFT_509413 [Syncephalastrum racemosum]